jgi:hypothetical protein
MRWLSDFQGALTLQVLLEFTDLHQVVEQVELQPRVVDVHLWRLSASGQFFHKIDLYIHVSRSNFVRTGRESLEDLGP